MNIGEEICGEWLRHLRSCEFIQYNLKTPEVQGEVDVIGLDMNSRTVFACEVAIHLVTGLQYTKNNQPDNVPKLIAKFEKDVNYLRKAFKDYKHVFMLWSPIVRNQRSGSKHNQMKDVEEIVKQVKASCDAEVELMINEKFQQALQSLRKAARGTTEAMESSVMRYLQVEERLAAHLLSTGMRQPPLSVQP